jgi:HlyD family secretion protein
MKRFVAVFVVLSLVLGGLLYWKLRLQDAAASGPPGSSGVAEAERVIVASRIASRIVAVHADEGDVVAPGELLAELDCADLDALVQQAEAQRAAAQAATEPVRRQAEAAAAQALGARKSAEAAASQAAAVRSQAEAAQGQAQAARSQVGSVRAQRENVERQRDRVTQLTAQEVTTTVDLEGLQTSAEDLRYRMGAAASAAQAAKLSAAAAGGQAEAAVNQAAAAGQQAAAAEAQALAAAGQVVVVQSQLAVAEAGVVRARVGQSECRIVAPRAGVVAVRAHAAGDVVLPGTTLFELLDPSDTRVRFYVANADLGRVAPGMRVTITADAFPGTTFGGVVRRVAEQAEFTPRSVQTRDDRERLVYEVEAQVENPDRRLRSGMPVEVVVGGAGR